MLILRTLIGSTEILCGDHLAARSRVLAGTLVVVRSKK